MCDEDDQMQVYEHSTASSHHALTISEDGGVSSSLQVQQGLQQVQSTHATEPYVKEKDVEALIEKTEN